MSDVLKMLKLGLTLAIYASVACLCLAAVNIFTAPRIEAAALAKANQGMTVVFADAKSFEQVELPTTSVDGVTLNAMHVAKDDSGVIGAVVEAVGPTYSEATLLIGLDLNNTITGIEFLAISDTPGFGQLATEPEFKDQFNGLPVDGSLVAYEDFDGVAGSTITTNGVTAIINAAFSVASDYLAENHGAQ